MDCVVERVRLESCGQSYTRNSQQSQLRAINCRVKYPTLAIKE